MRFDIEKIIIFDISENNAYNLQEELKITFNKARSDSFVGSG
jgi:FlaA1/EpsC-like NDP-sugar epimerase